MTWRSFAFAQKSTRLWSGLVRECPNHAARILSSHIQIPSSWLWFWCKLPPLRVIKCSKIVLLSNVHKGLCFCYHYSYSLFLFLPQPLLASGRSSSCNSSLALPFWSRKCLPIGDLRVGSLLEPWLHFAAAPLLIYLMRKARSLRGRISLPCGDTVNQRLDTYVFNWLKAQHVVLHLFFVRLAFSWKWYWAHLPYGESKWSSRWAIKIFEWCALISTRRPFGIIFQEIPINIYINWCLIWFEVIPTPQFWPY